MEILGEEEMVGLDGASQDSREDLLNMGEHRYSQCCGAGAGSGRIRSNCLDPVPDPTIKSHKT